jgi:hypothetical protein
MKTLFFFACLLVLTSLSATTGRADIAKPKPSEQERKELLRRRVAVVPDERTWSARLQISQSDLRELRAALDGAGSNTTVAASIAQSPARTIVAGTLLFLSLSFGGVWLARSGKTAGRSGKAIAAGLVVVAVLGAAAIITRGNAGPPPDYQNWMRLGKNFSHGKTTSGELVIEVVPDQPNTPPGMKLLVPYNPKQSGGDDE